MACRSYIPLFSWCMAQLYTEHTLRLPDGIDIRYTDSGAPNTPDYTTIVIIHGTGYNGYGFVRLHEYAHKYNIRTIFWNRRDYHGSTKYTDDELADMRAGGKDFQDRLALHTAWFFQHFIENENTPKVTGDRKAGGFILVGWSSGNAATLALFADSAVIPKPLYETLEPHLRSLVLYDPPFQVMGYLPREIEGLYDPFNDPDATTLDQMMENFQHLVGSYYKHPDITTGDPSGLWLGSFTDCKQTINQWTAEEKAKYYDQPAAIRSLAPLSSLGILKTQTHKALFDQDLVASYFPNVNVLYISGEETLFYCMWAYLESVRLYSEAIERGESVRPTKFKLVPEGNHFLHYDVPEIFLREIVNGCA
ncbi:Alpha/Beta hydrolase protein [Mycena epipterygia]|nr:Alpha/Beta hydrolase protein [Mycena epipterygia]